MKYLKILFATLFATFAYSQDQILIAPDWTQSQVLTDRAELYLEVNKAVDFQVSAEIWFEGRAFSSDVSATFMPISVKVDEISPSERYNLKSYRYDWLELTPMSSYEYRWVLKNGSINELETDWIQIFTTDGFGVVANQQFELPEEGLIPGDTIGVLKYENSFEKWEKIQTFYKSTFALKPTGELYAWGKNSRNHLGSFSEETTNVVYGQTRVTREPFTRGNHDYDFDGFFDEDEYISGTDVFDPDDYPQVDSDGDFLSDAFEELKGLDPNEHWLGGRKWFDWMYPLNQKTLSTVDYSWWEEYDFDTHNSIWYEDGPDSYNVRKDENDIFGLYAKDFATHMWTNYAINKFTGEIFAWGWDETGNMWNYNISEKRGAIYINYPAFLPRSLSNGIRFDKIFSSLNVNLYGFTGNPSNPVGWDNPVLAIDVDGNLYAWGIIDGVVVDYPMQIGEGSKWVDVAISDNIMALRDDGTLYEIGTDIPIDTAKIQTDSDGDGVPDVDDPFPWDPNAYADSDNDGAADNWEESWMQTDPDNPDTDGDGYLDGEDQLPLDEKYHADNDWDGLPDELDPDDNNPDVDNDGARDGDDADFYDDDPNYMNPERRWDCDRDGVSDEEEWERGSDACELDTDKDGVEDKFDAFPRSYYYTTDSDGDQIPDELEVFNGSDPNKQDTDGDGYNDGISQATANKIWPILNSLDCEIDCDHWNYFWRYWDLNRDCNGDGEITQDEWERESSECFNGANLRDMYPNDPEAIKNSDWDDEHDGIDDDDDNDGISDEIEIRLGSNPLLWDSKPQDSDGDNVPDVIEEEKGMDPFNRDSDGDGAWDGWDSWPLDPTIRHDRDLDRLEDWVEEEYFKTDPELFDSDGDGVSDFDDPFPNDERYTKDSDGDGLADAFEIEEGYNPNNIDTDGDGYFDAPCNPDKLIYWTDEYGNSWWEDNWRECEGYWSRVDTDGDGLWNDEDEDDDNDGILDYEDNDHYDHWQFNESNWKGDDFPKDPNEWLDTDGDKKGNNSDNDDDNDGVPDDEDDYPLDSRYKLNSDKPTIENGGLKDWDGDGVFGEDYGNDGWIDEMDHRHFDFIPDELDEDDDGDLFLDDDEDFNETDPLDKNDFPGVGFTDTDKDGLSNNYEIKIGSDPYLWDTDGDGVSDGWRYPHRNWEENFKIYIEVGSASATTIADQEYYIEFHGYNQPWEDRIRIEYKSSNVITGEELLQYFSDRINEYGGIKHENSSSFESFSSSVVSGTRLIIEGGDNDRSFYYVAFNTVIENGKLHVYAHDHESHQWKEGFYKTRNTEHWADVHYYYNGKGSWNNEHPYLIDAFPNDPKRFWDTDGDGIDDKIDNDIDGDGITNSLDTNPYLATNLDLGDLDEDGIPNIEDLDDDNDGWLDVDEIAVGTDPLNASSKPGGSGDSDRDGLSDAYEASIGTDPNDWDSDDDGVSDGTRFPSFDWQYRDNWRIVVEVPNTSSYLNLDDEFILRVHGHNQDWDDRLEITVNATSVNPLTGLDLLTVFKDELNNAGGVPYDQSSDTERFSASIDGNKLIIQGDNKERRLNVDGPSTLIGSDGKIHLYRTEHLNQLKGEIYYQDRNSDWCCNDYKIGTGRIDWGEKDRLYDMFPNDSSKFWDTDGDGTDDLSDDDIDGDGIKNEDDTLPYLNSSDNLDSDGDGVPNSIDENDDNDHYLDFDDPDPLVYTGGDTREKDRDHDGLTNDYEISIGTDPDNWDTDGDGISDGYLFPDWVSNWEENEKWRIIIEVADLSATVNSGEEFYLSLHGHNQRWEDRVEIRYTVSGTITAEELLTHFKDELNSHGSLLYNNSEATENFTALIDGRRLVIQGDDRSDNFNFNGFTTVVDNGVLYKVNDRWDHRSLNEFYYRQRDGETCCSNYRYSNGKPHGNDFSPYFKDMFPTDPNEYWDTDGDGMGDFSDDDIDGDGYSNGIDGAPYDPLNNLDTDGDGIGDNDDEDDDDDGFSDVDEAFNNTDSKDRDSCPGCYQIDADLDGLSYDYEIILGTDPDNWDSDGDGISDGHRYPAIDWDNQSKNYLVIEVADINAALNIGDNYRLRLFGNDSSWEDRLEFLFEVESSGTAYDLLSYFANKINERGFIYFDSRNGSQNLSAKVDKNRLVIESEGRERNYWMEAFSTINDGDVMYKLNDNYRQWQLGELYYIERSPEKPEWCCYEYKYNNGMVEWGDSYPYLIDAFPLNPDEYYDTDGDGIGDFADSDIDGDGYSNSQDEVPYDSRDHLDSDNDGIPNSIDQNKDNDNFLDIDEIGNETDPLVFTEEDGGWDSDRDGISDPYENERGSDPELWDTDGDGVSDGWRYPSTCEHYEWTNGSTWRDEFFRERNYDCGESWYYFRHGKIVGRQDGGKLFIDAFPTDPKEYWDTDDNGTGDNSDVDIDGDGSPNDYELLPRNNGYSFYNEYTQKDVISDPYNPDSDNDGFLDGEDEAPMDDKSIKDTDKDGRGDQSDNDIDGDGIINTEEEKLGLDLKNWDSDGDGYSDGDCLPNWNRWDINDNWREGFSFTGSSTTIGDYISLRFHPDGTDWDKNEFVEIFIDEELTPEQLALKAKNVIESYSFPTNMSNFTTTVSGSLVVLTGQSSGSLEGRIKIFPDDAEEWAGVSNNNWDDFPISFQHGGVIKFTAASLEPIPLHFNFQRMPYPDTEPSFFTDTAFINGIERQDNGNYKEYSIEIPSQPSENEYSNVILYLESRGVEVVVDDVFVYAYDESGNLTKQGKRLEFRRERFGGFQTYYKSPRSKNFHFDIERAETRVNVFLNSGCSWFNIDKFTTDPNEWSDRDHDNIGDNEDTDDDNDGLLDTKEIELGTNPLAWDTDKDCEGDQWDAFPLDPLKSQDFDGDGIVDYQIIDPNGNIVNNCFRKQAEDEPDSGYTMVLVDPDTDNDGMSNEEENALFNNLERQENGWDQELIAFWNREKDYDHDGYIDGEDAFPKDDRFHGDLDGDKHPDRWDPDIDGDGFRNKDEESNGTDPRDPESYPTKDSDGDKVSDKYEIILKTDLDNTDTDGDGYNDNVDDYPLNLNEWSDYNNNNYPDNLDQNDDDDDLPDFVEIWLGLDEKSVGTQHWDYFGPSQDTDYDRVPSELEQEMGTDPNNNDSDEDGCGDDYDQIPNNPDGCNDLDGDNIPDHSDDDVDGDGLLNWDEQSSFVRSDPYYPDSDGDGVLDGEDYLPMDKRIRYKEDINSSLFDFEQFGNKLWKDISSYSFNLQAGTYGGVDSEGDLYFWGTNFGGMPLTPESEEAVMRWTEGDDYSYPVFEPQRFLSDRKFKTLDLGKKFGIAITEKGDILSWGTNLSSQLAKGNISTYEEPSYPDTSINNIVQITAGDQQAGVINRDGKLRMFGSNDSGQLGTSATNPNTPQELSWEGIDDIKKVIVTETETFILTENGDLWSYGDNVYGQLGRGYRSIRADDYVHKKSPYGDWEDIFAASGKFYGFKKTDGSLWAWGRNDNYDLGIGVKSEFELEPVKIEGINLNSIKDFVVNREGFSYINSEGALYGAGSNFYSGGWVPLRSPRQIGSETDWKSFYDASSARINIMVQKEDNSIWAAGQNWNGNLGYPCPENFTKIVSVDFTHPQVKQIDDLTLTHSETSIDYILSINSSIVTFTASNSIEFVNKLKESIETSTVSELVSIDVSLSNDIQNEGSKAILSAKSLQELNVSISYSATDTNVIDLSGIISHSLTTTQNPKFGTATYTIKINGNRIDAAGNSKENALNNMLIALSGANNIDTNEFSFTVTNNLLFIENVYYNQFGIGSEVQNSSFSEGSISLNNEQELLHVDCNDGWLNDLYEIIDPDFASQIKDISMGLYHTLILMNDGTIRSMGADHYGQLGRNGDWRSAELVGDQNNWVKIKASGRVSFAINSDGEMYAWGRNQYGQLGVGDFSNKQNPTLVQSSTPSLTIDWSGNGENLGGYDFQIARDNNGNAYGWGYKKFGKLGALGKLKADLVGWNVDDSQMDGIVDFDQETDYLIASEELVNNLAQINFENYTLTGDVSATTLKGINSKSTTGSKGNIVFNPEGYKSKQTKFKTNPKNSGKRKNSSRGVGKWKVKKKVNAFTGAASIFNGEASSAITSFEFAVVDVNERPENITLSSNEISIETEELLQTIGTIEVTDPDQDDEITVSLSPNSQNTELFEIDARGLHLVTSVSENISGVYDIIIRATDFEGLSYEKAFIITVRNNILDEVEEVEEENTLTLDDSRPTYNPRYADTDGDGVTDFDELRAGTDYRNFEEFPRDSDVDGIYDFEDGDIDNDGILNENDAFPDDPTESADIDGDGIGDNADQDSDNDGVLNVDIDWANSTFTYDLFPLDPTESSDFDNDGVGDNADLDDDNDGVNDTDDLFPLDPSEWADTDRDNIGDNTDEDIDGDNYLNIHEEQAGSDPYNPSSVPADLDGDLFPDIIDLDVDGDGILNEFDTAPNFANPNQEYLPNDPNYITIEAAEFFSPNGDGINDTWTFPEIQRFPLNQVWIYASDGTLVFHEKSYANTWDGSFNGSVLQVGSYLYRVDVDGNGTIDFEGWLYLSD